MMSSKRGESTCTCDSCGHPEHAGIEEFREFVDRLKKLGWKFHKEDDQWVHTCPGCVRGD